MARINYTKISKKTFTSKLESSFPGTLMTMLSVVQGVAFSLYILELSKFIDSPNYGIAHVFPYLMTFVGIVTVFFFYSWFILVTYNPPSWHESLVLFSLGGAQSLSTQYMDQLENWWLAWGAFTFVGMLAFLNSKRSLRDFHYGNKFLSAYHLVRNETNKNIYFCFAMSFVAILAAYFPDIKGAPIFLTGFLAFGIIWKSQKYLDNLYNLAGMVERGRDERKKSE